MRHLFCLPDADWFTAERAYPMYFVETKPHDDVTPPVQAQYQQE